MILNALFNKLLESVKKKGNLNKNNCDDGDIETKMKNMERKRQRFEESIIWNYIVEIIRRLKALNDKKK